MAIRIVLPADAAGYSAGLYAALHQLDAAGLDRIVVETPPEGDEWLAVHDRLRRAAANPS
jgi:L-threonylcarbamoyladenylate synthase